MSATTQKFNNFQITHLYQPRPYEPKQYDHYESASLTFTIDQNSLLNTNKKLSDKEIRNYSLLGEQRNRITQHSNISQKLKILSQEQLPETDDDKKSDNSDGVKRNFSRYFEDVNSYDTLIKGLCRRCQQPGHFAQWCTQDPDDFKQQAQVCNFCLGDHFHLRCPNTLCYGCNQSGHMSKNCPEQQYPIRCRTCGIKGHIARACGVLIDDFYKRQEETKDLKSMKCLICHERGHLNCNDVITKKRKSYKIDNIYSDTYLEFFQKKVKIDTGKYLAYNYVQEQETEVSIKSFDFDRESHREDKIQNSRKFRKHKEFLQGKLLEKQQKVYEYNDHNDELQTSGVFQSFKKSKVVRVNSQPKQSSTKIFQSEGLQQQVNSQPKQSSTKIFQSEEKQQRVKHRSAHKMALEYEEQYHNNNPMVKQKKSKKKQQSR